MSWWDIVIIIFIALAIWRGYHKGLMLRLGGWVGGLLMFFVVLYNLGAVDRALSPHVNGRKMVKEWLYNYLTRRAEQGHGLIDVSELHDLINRLPMPAEVESHLLEQLNNTTQAASHQAYLYVSQWLAVPVWQVLLLVGTWAVGLFGLYVLSRLLRMGVRRVPKLETIDRFMGAIFSAFFSLVMIGLIGMVLSVFSSHEVMLAVNQSFFAEGLEKLIKILVGFANPLA